MSLPERLKHYKDNHVYFTGNIKDQVHPLPEEEQGRLGTLEPIMPSDKFVFELLWECDPVQVRDFLNSFPDHSEQNLEDKIQYCAQYIENLKKFALDNCTQHPMKFELWSVIFACDEDEENGGMYPLADVWASSIGEDGTIDESGGMYNYDNLLCNSLIGQELLEKEGVNRLVGFMLLFFKQKFILEE